MTDKSKGEGHCLCGAVYITAWAMSNKVGACHCGMCRRWTGGPLMAVNCGSEVTFEGKENISVFESSQWAERGFCKKCGSHLFYRLKEENQYIIPAGIFENGENLVFDNQVFIDKKPAYYSFSNETQNMTEAEIFAMYGSSPEKG
ncbi:MAG: GFA family protein [Deltaproteobacteria bacterium]|nr:GFA family protein [Deltaproteobacteria bacterium]